MALGCTCSLPAMAQPVAVRHQITMGQAQQIARLVARHDEIDLSDTHIEFNSMDLDAAFIPGFASFIVIHEASTPGPDETLRRYAVNRRTGDVWEITLCTRYDFPALSRLRRSYAGHATTTAAEVAAQSRELGCSKQKSGSSTP
ncbi:MAG: effector immunity protein Tgi2PP [Acidobacteriaceae bacterium]